MLLLQIAMRKTVLGVRCPAGGDTWYQHQPGSPLHAVMLLQIAMWEEYAGKLEEQLRALVQDNQLLQGALQAVRTSLASGQPASPASTGTTH